MPDSISAAVARVTDRVASAATRSGRDPAAVRIVAAIKYASIDAVTEAVEAGIRDLGANHAKDLSERSAALDPSVRWHYLGEIQTNKVRYLDRAVLVHGLDRDREAEALQARGDAIDRTWDVLVEVNLAGEQAKHGVAADDVEPLLERLSAYPRVTPRGFMFMAPVVENAEDVRWLFAEGRRLRERFGKYGLEELSMGMTDDFEVAVEEGSTIVRIGRAIFEPTEGSS